MDVRTIIVSGFTGIAIIVLGGCSDGGGSDLDPSPGIITGPSSSINNVTLEGTAAKGIINFGNIVAEELKADGTVLAQVGNTITDADGYYSLMVNSYFGGPIKVTVSADANTQMKCDVPKGCGTRGDDGIEDTLNPTVVDFGEWYKPGSLNMMALVAEAVANESINVNITPYTNLAANYALAASPAMAGRALDTGSLTSAGVYKANSEVSNLLRNINILDTRPVDITDPDAVSDGRPEEVAYAAVSAAVLIDADVTSGNPDINGALDTLTRSFSDGSIVADDTGTATDDSTISLQEIIDGASGVLDQAGGIADVSGTLAALQADVDAVTGGGTVDPTPGDTADAAALVKVKAFVGDVRTWGVAVAAQTGASSNAFGVQTEQVSTAANLSMNFLIGPAFYASAEAIDMRFHDRNTSPNLVDYETGLPTGPQFTEGTIARLDDVITITDGVIDGVTVNMEVRLPVDNAVFTTGSSITVEVISASFESAATDAYINSGQVTLNLAAEYVVDWTAIEQGSAVMPGILSGSADLGMTLIQKQDRFGMPLDVEMTFTGTALSEFINPGAATGAANDISGIIPGTLIMDGIVSDTAGNSFAARFTFNIPNIELLAITGMLDTASARIGLDFVMQLAGLPKAYVNINGTGTDFEVGTTTITITYSGRKIIIQGDNLTVSTDGVVGVGEVTIINQDAVSIIFAGDLGTLEGDVKFNNISYATISRMSNGLAKITYSDGTFEIL